MAEKEYITGQDIADMMSVDIRTVQNWAASGIITRYSMTAGTVRYRKVEVLEALRRKKYGDQKQRADPMMG